MSEVHQRVEELFHQYKDELYRHALFVLGNKMDAEDAVSEVFIKVLRSINSFAGRSQIRTWLWSIMRNQCRDMLKAQKRLNPNCVLHEVEPEASGQDVDLFLWNETIKMLKEPYRQVISLRYIQGFDTNQTAVVLGWTETRVRIMLFRAKRQLRSELSEEPTNLSEGGRVSH